MCVCSASKHVSAGLGSIPRGILVGLATLLGGRWLFLCANLDAWAGQRFFNNVSSGLLTFAHGKRTFLCAEHEFFFDFFVVLPCVRLLALSDVARADSRDVFVVVLRL